MIKMHVKNMIQAGTMLFWISFLLKSDSYFMPYLIIAVAGFISLYRNCQEKQNGRINKGLVSVGAGVFSFIVLAANYSMLQQCIFPDFSGEVFDRLYQESRIVLLGCGGYFTAWNLLYCAGRELSDFSWKEEANRFHPAVFFCVSWCLIAAVNIVLLFACRYPGSLSPDSFSQIGQIMSGQYSNHHPFYHTMVIKLLLEAGLRLFGDINAAIALYCVFQILFMAMCFAMAGLTLYELNIPLRWAAMSIIWYAVMPFHIMYSFTIWKDVMFGGLVLLFLVYTFRILKEIGRYPFINYIMLFFSGLGVCLFRSNGFFAFLIIFLAFLVLLGKRKPSLCIVFVSIIIIGFILKHPALSYFKVSQPDAIEALSIPAQQIARVAVDHDDFTDEQRSLLNRVADLEAVKEAYYEKSSDPVKNLVRSKDGGQEYLISHKLSYIKLYIEVGLRHPLTYFYAWVDETRGYWNAGYDYWRWISGGKDSLGLGIANTVRSENVDKWLNEWLWLFENSSFLQIFLCIGFYVWIDLFLLFISIVRKDRIGLFMTIPIVAIIVSLLVSTPVYAEFRYAYAVFCGLPFVIGAVFCRRNMGGGR